MKSNLSQVLFLFLSALLLTKSQDLCKTGHIIGDTSFRDESFPSLARIVDVKTNGFICRAALIRKHQFITTPSCVQDDHNVKRNAHDIAIVLQHFNRNKTVKREVNEIYINPDWSETHEPETRVALVITVESAPYDFFILTTCLRQFIMNEMNEKIIHLMDPCQHGRRVKRHNSNNTWIESRFTRDTGALYIKHQDEMFLFGMFRSNSARDNECESLTGSHVVDVYKYFKCDHHSSTTVVGARSAETFCQEELIFEDNFNELSNQTWRHENSLAGGGTWEFQWYSSDPNNSFVKDGILHLRPTLTADLYGEKFLTKGIARIPYSECTYKISGPDFYGCRRHGRDNLINPIRSASITTINSFAFKYGTVEIRAKMATGDWLTSAISLLPKKEIYGQWPASGQIDLAETKGNRDLKESNEHIGIEKVSCTLHFGSDFSNNRWEKSHGSLHNSSRFGSDFHIYKLKWTPESISMFVDDQECFHVDADEGLWKKYQFQSNIWSDGEVIAPFDKEFFISLSLKVGGVVHYPDDAENKPNEKPWDNHSQHASQEFWDSKSAWLPTWDGDDVDLQVDYVRVYAS